MLQDFSRPLLIGLRHLVNGAPEIKGNQKRNNELGDTEGVKETRCAFYAKRQRRLLCFTVCTLRDWKNEGYSNNPGLELGHASRAEAGASPLSDKRRQYWQDKAKQRLLRVPPCVYVAPEK